MLYARTADQRTATFSKTLGLGADYLRETRALLLRINLMRADFVVKGSSEAHGPSKSSRQEQRHASGPSAGPSASSSVPPAAHGARSLFGEAAALEPLEPTSQPTHHPRRAPGTVSAPRADRSGHLQLTRSRRLRAQTP